MVSLMARTLQAGQTTEGESPSPSPATVRGRGELTTLPVLFSPAERRSDTPLSLARARGRGWGRGKSYARSAMPGSETGPAAASSTGAGGRGGGAPGTTFQNMPRYD